MEELAKNNASELCTIGDMRDYMWFNQCMGIQGAAMVEELHQIDDQALFECASYYILQVQSRILKAAKGQQWVAASNCAKGPWVGSESGWLPPLGDAGKTSPGRKHYKFFDPKERTVGKNGYIAASIWALSLVSKGLPLKKKDLDSLSPFTTNDLDPYFSNDRAEQWLADIAADQAVFQKVLTFSLPAYTPTYTHLAPCACT